MAMMENSVVQICRQNGGTGLEAQFFSPLTAFWGVILMENFCLVTELIGVRPCL